MAGPNNPTPRKPNALSEYKLRIVGDPVNGAKRPPTLGFSVNKNQPQIDVRTNVEGDKDYGRISAKLDTPTLFLLLADLEQVAAGPADVKKTLAASNFRFINGKRSDAPMLDSKVVYGKDKEGVVFIGVMSWEQGRPIIKFPFRPTNLYSLSNSDGSAASPADVSVAMCRGWVKIITQIVGQILVDEYVEPPPRDDSRGGGGGGGYGGGGGNNNNNRAGGGGGGYSGGGSGGGGGGNASDGATGGDDFPM